LWVRAIDRASPGMTRFAAAVLALAACTSSTDDGLALEARTADRVAGTFAQDGVSIAFEFSRDGDQHVLQFTRPDGSPLVTTTIDGALQSTDVFGGRLVIAGVPNLPDPSIIGDESAMEELQALPEAELLEGLAVELAAADVDIELYQPPPPKIDGLTNTWATGYFVLTNNQSMTFLSAAGASPTYIYLRKYSDYADHVTIWYAPQSYASSGFLRSEIFYGYDYTTKYWWGAAFNVTCVSYYNCMVRVSPYTWSPL
jgi:hypothetical protein